MRNETYEPMGVFRGALVGESTLLAETFYRYVVDKIEHGEFIPSFEPSHAVAAALLVGSVGALTGYLLERFVR